MRCNDYGLSTFMTRFIIRNPRHEISDLEMQNVFSPSAFFALHMTAYINSSLPVQRGRCEESCETRWGTLLFEYHARITHDYNRRVIIKSSGMRYTVYHALDKTLPNCIWHSVWPITKTSTSDKMQREYSYIHDILRNNNNRPSWG